MPRVSRTAHSCWVGWIVGGLFTFLVARPAFAGELASSITATLKTFNTELILIGVGLTVTAFLWALLAQMLRMGGTAVAVSVLVLGIAVTFSPEIVGAIVRFRGIGG